MERSPTLSRPCSNVAFSVRLTRTTPGETAAYLHPPNPPLLLHLLHGSHHLLNYFSDTVFYFLSPAAERQRWQVQDYCFFVTTVSAVSKPLPGWLNCSVAAAPWMGHPSGHCPPSSVTVTLRRKIYASRHRLIWTRSRRDSRMSVLNSLKIPLPILQGQGTVLCHSANQNHFILK